MGDSYFGISLNLEKNKYDPLFWLGV